MSIVDLDYRKKAFRSSNLGNFSQISKKILEISREIRNILFS